MECFATLINSIGGSHAKQANKQTTAWNNLDKPKLKLIWLLMRRIYRNKKYFVWFSVFICSSSDDRLENFCYGDRHKSPIDFITPIQIMAVSCGDFQNGNDEREKNGRAKPPIHNAANLSWQTAEQSTETNAPPWSQFYREKNTDSVFFRLFRSAKVIWPLYWPRRRRRSFDAHSAHWCYYLCVCEIELITWFDVDQKKCK